MRVNKMIAAATLPAMVASPVAAANPAASLSLRGEATESAASHEATAAAAAQPEAAPTGQEKLTPYAGEWRTVGASADVPAGGALPFDLGTVNGFVHRSPDGLEAVSGICTHQGCKLSLDAPDQRLRCPCHLTSFTLDGTTATHQLPVAPPPLPKFRAREVNGRIEVFAPAETA